MHGSALEVICIGSVSHFYPVYYKFFIILDVDSCSHNQISILSETTLACTSPAQLGYIYHRVLRYEENGLVKD